MIHDYNPNNNKQNNLALQFEESILAAMEIGEPINIGDIHEHVRKTVVNGSNEMLRLRIYEKLRKLETSGLVTYNKMDKEFTKI